MDGRSRQQWPREENMFGSRPGTGNGQRQNPLRRPARMAALFGVVLAGLSANHAAAPASAAERPPVMGPNAGVSAGHPLTTAAAFEILTRGGNAFDAGVAALLVGGVVEQDLYSLGGEALVLVYPRHAGKVTAVVGHGSAPPAP